MSKEINLGQEGSVRQSSEVQKTKKFTLKYKPFSLKYILLYLLAIFLTTPAYLAASNLNSFEILYNFYINDSHPRFETIYETYTIELPASLNQEFSTALADKLVAIEFNGTPRYKIVQSDGEIQLKFDVNLEPNDEEIAVLELVPVGHFYWVKDSVTKDELLKNGLYLDEKSDLDFSESLEQAGITVTVEKDLLGKLQSSESKPALLPYQDLDYRYKLLNYNGIYRLDGEEPLITMTLASDFSEKAAFLEQSLTTLLAESVDEDSATLTVSEPFTINMTGVTAITRGLIPKINAAKDGAYPARKIGDFLASADLTHISNEISFADGCTYQAGVSFCAPNNSIEALKLSGVDIVELTGNHNNDYGASKNSSTINTYKELGWEYFGGGLNSDDAAKPLIKDVDGSKVAFLGYNYYNSIYNYVSALASATAAGANSYTAAKVSSDIKALRDTVDFIIVDFQYQECYSYPDGPVIYPVCYRSDTVANQETVFRVAIDAGADMVVGTQAHQPQTYEIYNGKPIFYGLGNLFFDQINWPGTRHGIILTHYFIGGRYVQTKLTTTNYNNDMQTYVSTGEERKLLLDLLKAAR